MQAALGCVFELSFLMDLTFSVLVHAVVALEHILLIRNPVTNGLNKG